jgi:fumarylacetoacetase
MIDDTHNPALQSWVTSANLPEADFPLQNLPFGCFRPAGSQEQPRPGVAIGDQILDLKACVATGLFSGPLASALQQPVLNDLLALGPAYWTRLRSQLSALLRADAPARTELLVPQAEAELVLPAAIGDYTDAYASRYHAANVGALFRPDTPLLPNYTYVPIAYHGRASSLVISGTPVWRPAGQQRINNEQPPVFAPSRQLDYELELGALIGPGNAPGNPIPIAEAQQQIFGYCLVNDWSARDIQRWEYQPLGPFLGKNFLTSLSPWLVTSAALAPFRAPAFARPTCDPPPLGDLFCEDDQANGGLAITVEAWLTTAAMRQAGEGPFLLSRGSVADMYWTFGQLVTHHTSNGCNLRPGDLIASGTLSGPTPDSLGCLLELTSGGKRPLVLPTTEERQALQAGDEITLRAYCERPGYHRIGFGSCVGRITD